MAGQFGRIELLKRDRKLEGEIGVDIKVDDHIFLTVLAASDANVRWFEQAPKVLRDLKRLENAGAKREDIRRRMAKLYADTLILGWRGVVDAEGRDVLFTAENCAAFLFEADDAFAMVEADCYNTQNFRTARAEAIVDSAKNASSGTE